MVSQALPELSLSIEASSSAESHMYMKPPNHIKNKVKREAVSDNSSWVRASQHIKS